MKFYIDPGTGSMLFTILIGILGALRYVFKSWFVKLRFFLSGGRKVKDDGDKLPLVIFSEGKQYWNIFNPVCRELEERGIEAVYMTASEEDPALKNEYKHIKTEFIGIGNKAFAKLNFLNADIVLATTPGLDVYQWKRSREVKSYIHMFHAAGDVTLYRMFGVDYYDALLISGDYQEKQIRDLEGLRNLPAKEIVKVGIPYMDEMLARFKKNPAMNKNDGKVTVLLAPSWGPSAILSKYGKKIIDVLLETGYHVIVRPHPQSFTPEKDLMESLMMEYPNSEQLEWNRDADNFEVLKRSDILISDFSGVIFDFALVYDKPVIYADTSFDDSVYDAWWLDYKLWTFEILPYLGMQLNADNMGKLKEMIDQCINEEKYAEGRKKAIADTWAYQGEGAKRVVDFIVKKQTELGNKAEN